MTDIAIVSVFVTVKAIGCVQYMSEYVPCVTQIGAGGGGADGKKQVLSM
jgi:hypothetical protein